MMAESIRVWDIGVRLFHWTLAAAVTGAAITGFVLGRTSLAWHLVAGEISVVCIAWRMIWGFLGPTYARFDSFAFRPSRVLAYLNALRRSAHHRHLGHNPLGAMMVFALLGVVAAIALSGTISLGGMLKQGPLRAFVTFATGSDALAIHNALAILLLILIGLHLCGVAFESWRGRENLVAAMLTGDKPAVPEAAALRPRNSSPRAAVAILLAACLASTAVIVALASIASPLLPPADPDPVFAEQCGACHLAFPPVLAPQPTWNAILADLPHHFGADASLDPGLVAHIRAWLDANAAERWDTLPSHLLRTPAPEGSLRITDTPGWRERHRGIAGALFAADPIYRRSNCAACHSDAATGRFAPQNISIPDLIAASGKK